MAPSRRLSAIMFTDMVESTQLAQKDEPSALALIEELEKLARPVLAAHHGRWVKSTGDGFLAELPSALDAVESAVDLQGRIRERNLRPGSVPLRLRVGVHLGDVQRRAGDIFGDAVNVAARVESAAEPGGICISGPVYELVRNKVSHALERLGAQTLKGIDQPVELYRVAMTTGGVREPPRPAAVPRLAVLPLANISPDPSDGFFADGLTDELISQVSRITSLRVIARTSVLQYKGSTKPLKEVARDLGVKLALEGSVRKSGNQLRVTVQLVDTASEEQLWTSRYDRPLADIFAIQDDIAGHIARAVAAHVSGAPAAGRPTPTTGSAETSDMEAYSLFLHGRQLFGEHGSLEAIRTALALFENAVARDPKFARARVGLAEALLWLATEGSTHFRDAEDRAYRELRTALDLNDGIAEAHSVLAALYLGSDRFVECEREARRAMELNPSLADPYRWLAQLAAGQGDIHEAVRLLEAARQMNPDDVNVLSFYGRALAYAGREADALAFWEATKSRVRFRTNSHMCEYYLGKGDLARAQACLREMEHVRPDSPWTLVYRGALAVRQGDPATAHRMVERLEARALQGEMVVFFIGFLHYWLGEMDEFIASMEEAQRRGVLPLLELLYSPLYAAARANPRVQDILRRQREIQNTSPAKAPA